MAGNLDYNAATAVISFPVEGPQRGVYRSDITALRHLEMIRLVQENWAQPGRAHTKYTDGHHNVSNAVNVTAAEWDQVAEFIWENRYSFTGVALLSATGDKEYRQTPREEIATEEDDRRWNALSDRPVASRLIPEREDVTAGLEHRGATVARAGGKCEIG